MARLRSANARLQQENHEKDNALQHYKVTTELTLDLYRELGKEILQNALQRLRLSKQLRLVHLMLAQSPLTTLISMAMMVRTSAEHTWMPATIRVETMPLCDAENGS